RGHEQGRNQVALRPTEPDDRRNLVQPQPEGAGGPNRQGKHGDVRQHKPRHEELPVSTRSYAAEHGHHTHAPRPARRPAFNHGSASASAGTPARASSGLPMGRMRGSASMRTTAPPCSKWKSRRARPFASSAAVTASCCASSQYSMRNPPPPAPAILPPKAPLARATSYHSS